MANYYPPVGFHFKVEVLGLLPSGNDTRFTEVSGLSVEMITEEVTEGGENRFHQKYPVRAKYPELVLKRGLLVDSQISNWIRQCIEDFNIEPKNVDVKLLNERHEPLLTWHVVNAYPTKWAVTDFSASNNAVLIESIQFCYQYYRMDKG
jgi:phage tail-like protein